MRRISSKGNPYHDAKGRFTSADGKSVNKATGKVEDREVAMWSSFGTQVHADGGKDKSEWESIDKNETAKGINSGERFYHKQSVTREKYAQSVAFYEIPKGLTMQERRDFIAKQKKKWQKENSATLNKTPKPRIVYLHQGNKTTVRIVEAERISQKTEQKLSEDFRNTATTMKQFHGFTVSYTSNGTVRSSKRGASRRDVASGIGKYTQKHKTMFQDEHTRLRVWTDRTNQTRFMAVQWFESESDAKAFAAKHPKAVITNHDDGHY